MYLEVTGSEAIANQGTRSRTFCSVLAENNRIACESKNFIPTTATIATPEPFVKPRRDLAARLEAAQPIAELTPGASVTRNQG